MSLRINVELVEAVLLSDGWHLVHDKSFDLDSYEFMDGDECIHGGGHSGVCATGFIFISDNYGDNKQMMSGPLTAILAVHWRRDVGD